MRWITNLRWYERIGWLVDVLMVAIGGTFVAFNFRAYEIHAAVVGIMGTLIPVGVWTCVLLYFGKGNDISEAGEA